VTDAHFNMSMSNGNAYLAATGTGNLIFATGTADWSERMRIDSSGNVGIGTQSPDALLHVQHTSVNQAFIVANRYNDTSTGSDFRPIFAVAEADPHGAGTTATIIGNHNRHIHIGPYFAPDGTTSATSANLTLLSTGNVGVGIDTPSSKLHVSGQTKLQSSGEAGPHTYRDGNSGNDIRFFSTNGTFASPTAKTNNSSVGQIHWAGYDGSGYQQRASVLATVDGNVSSGSVPMRLCFWTGTTSNAERMRIDSSGRVTTPMQPAFRAGYPSGTTITNNVNNKHPFTSVAINRGNNYSGPNARFTAPVAGIYRFNACFWINANNNGDFAPRLNGSSWIPSAPGSDSIVFVQRADSYIQNLSGTFMLELQANDYVELQSRNYTANYYAGHSWWEGHLIG